MTLEERHAEHSARAEPLYSWSEGGLNFEQPTVATVIIPTYQSRSTLERAIESALKQSMRNVEIIVADDGSTDSSWHFVSDLAVREPQLRALRANTNVGKSKIMNYASSYARGRWLAVLDADDWYDPGRLASLIALGEKYAVPVVVDNQFLYDAVADRVVGTAWSRGDMAWRLTLDDYLRGSNAYDGFNFGMLKPIVRMDFLRKFNLSYDERTRIGEDFLYLLNAFLLGGTVVVSDTPYYFYTQPFGTESRQWANTSRRRYDFQAAYYINQIYLQEIGRDLKRQQSRLLKRRSHQLASLEAYFRARELLAERDWRSSAKRLASDLLGTLYFAAYRFFNRYLRRALAPTVSRIAATSRQRRAGLSG